MITYLYSRVVNIRQGEYGELTQYYLNHNVTASSFPHLICLSFKAEYFKSLLWYLNTPEVYKHNIPISSARNKTNSRLRHLVAINWEFCGRSLKSDEDSSGKIRKYSISYSVLWYYCAINTFILVFIFISHFDKLLSVQLI